MCFFCVQLKSLGELCGLVSEKGPTSEDLNRTVDLLAGLGDERPETGMFSAVCVCVFVCVFVCVCVTTAIYLLCFVLLYIFLCFSYIGVY